MIWDLLDALTDTQRRALYQYGEAVTTESGHTFQLVDGQLRVGVPAYVETFECTIGFAEPLPGGNE